ncbi:MAG TPA: hypothetical protein PKO47_08915, partial [bacterium]|nr:hypothetical protein [bacterium]
MNHSPGFLKVVNDSKTRVREISVQQCLDDIQKNPAIALIDVREESDVIPVPKKSLAPAQKFSIKVGWKVSVNPRDDRHHRLGDQQIG